VPRTSITRSPLSRIRRTARFCFGLAPSRRVPPGAHPKPSRTARRGTSRTSRINSVPTSPKISHGRQLAPFAPSGRCKSHGVRHLEGFAWERFVRWHPACNSERPPQAGAVHESRKP
jgi:hypothetical protein